MVDFLITVIVAYLTSYAFTSGRTNFKNFVCCVLTSVFIFTILYYVGIFGRV